MAHFDREEWSVDDNGMWSCGGVWCVMWFWDFVTPIIINVDFENQVYEKTSIRSC